MANINHKKAKPVISVDWTLNNNRSKPFYQPKTEAYPPAGKTTKDADHIHQYNVDELGC